ncbi:MAG: DUF1566 domain-containing protein [Gammaproteobacteria bacterium]
MPAHRVVAADAELEALERQLKTLEAEEGKRIAGEKSRAAAKAEGRARAEAQARAKEQAEDEARAKTEAEVRAQLEAARLRPSPLLEDAGGGVLRQPSRGREWTQIDNGSDIDWHQAGAYCTNKGGRWRLPTVAELQSLYDASLAGLPCGGGICNNVSPMLRLTGNWFWSNETSSSSGAWIVILNSGGRFSTLRSYGYGQRALCVRPS